VIISLALTRRLKWRGREIFELAGESVEEIGTATPHDRARLESGVQPTTNACLCTFLCPPPDRLPYSTSKNITLVPIKMEKSLSLLGFSVIIGCHLGQLRCGRRGLSAHCPEGLPGLPRIVGIRPALHILWQVFIDFFELFNKGEGIRVIDRMDDLKLSISS